MTWWNPWRRVRELENYLRASDDHMVWQADRYWEMRRELDAIKAMRHNRSVKAARTRAATKSAKRTAMTEQLKAENHERVVRQLRDSVNQVSG